MSLYQKWGEPEFQDAWFDIQEWEWRDYDDWQAKEKCSVLRCIIEWPTRPSNSMGDMV